MVANRTVDEVSDEDVHGASDDLEEEEEAGDAEEAPHQTDECEVDVTFGSLGCDLRVVKGVMRMGLVRPTLVQSRCVPVALSGHDMLISAHTGTGKTLSYAMPMLHTLLKHVDGASSGDTPALAIVLVPTRDLCADATKTLNKLAHFCKKDVSIVSVNSSAALSCINGSAVVIVGTPSRVLATVEKQKATIDMEASLRMLVIDEADLVLSYGYDEDVDEFLQMLPRRQHQTILLSATLTPQLEKLKSMALNKPAIVRLKEDEHEQHQANRLQQFVVHCPEEDRYLMAYALLKLGPMKGKTLVFVNNATECFRLKLFLEGFSMNAAVLNAELPANSRHRIVQEFNRGMFDLLIATDEAAELGVQAKAEPSEQPVTAESDDAGKGDGASDRDDDNALTEAVREKPAGDNAAKAKAKLEFGIARGVDFRDVANVFNMSLPTTLSSYVHRVGRTARGGRKGVAVSLVVDSSAAQQEMLQQIQDHYAVTVAGQRVAGVKDLPFSIEMIAAFRYRVDSVLQTVTLRAVREARLKELRLEMLNSSRLRAHFEDRPRELALLKSDKVLRPTKVEPGLSSIPTYLLPVEAQAAVAAEHGSAGPSKRKPRRRQHRRDNDKRKRDPLNSFSAFKGKKRRR